MQRVMIALDDDLTGGEADETVSFSIDGTAYEIDLTAENAAELRQSLDRYVSAGRRVTKSAAAGRRRTGPGSEGGNKRNAQIREWAHEQGMEVSARGRLSAQVVEAWENRHQAGGHRPQEQPARPSEHAPKPSEQATPGNTAKQEQAGQGAPAPVG